MTMTAKDAPRRLYPRAGSLVLCFDGLYFGPRSSDTSALTKDDQVTVEVLPKKGAVHRIKVTQVVDGGKAIVETWTSRELERIRPARGVEKAAKAG